MKLYLIVMLSIILVGCTNTKVESIDNKETTSVDTGSASVNKPDKVEVIDSSTTGNGELDTAAIFGVIDKMTTKKNLNDTDYLIIDDFMMNNMDESLGEGVGGNLFEYFKNNKTQNKSLLVFLNKKGEKYKDDYLHMLIKAMCIDIESNEYTYDRLIAEFEIFRNNERVKKSFKDCMASDIQ